METIFIIGIGLAILLFTLSKKKNGSTTTEVNKKPQKPKQNVAKKPRKKFKPEEHIPSTDDYSAEEQTLNFELEKLKVLPVETKVDGTKMEPYTVNLHQLSCTCEDFAKRRETMPPDDIRRLCKHQANAILKSGLTNKISTDKRIRAIVRRSQDRGFDVFDISLKITWKIPMKGPGSFYIFAAKANDWINVLFFTEKSFQKFGYNKKENRWAREDNPFPDGTKTRHNYLIQQIITTYNL